MPFGLVQGVVSDVMFATNAAERWLGLYSPQCIEQRLGFLEVWCLKALSEPSTHGREQIAGVSIFALVVPELGETGGST